MTIPTQKEWVEGCLAYYKENDYQPGNPEDGVWQECHYPAPKCLGGKEVVLLLKEHHAVQGVLQSEEFQHTCVYGWEKKFLGGELLKLYKKWMEVRAQQNLNSRTKEERRQAKKKADETLGEAGRRRMTIKGVASQTPEERREKALKGWENLTPEQRTARAMKQVRAQTPEQRREKALKGWETRRKKKGGRLSDPPTA
jgi:hypothetical protein